MPARIEHCEATGPRCVPATSRDRDSARRAAVDSCDGRRDSDRSYAPRPPCVREELERATAPGRCPWMGSNKEDQKWSFVLEFLSKQWSMTELCERFRVSWNRRQVDPTLRGGAQRDSERSPAAASGCPPDPGGCGDGEKSARLAGLLTRLGSGGGRWPWSREADEGTIQSAIEKVATATNKKSNGLTEDVTALVDSIKRLPWTTLSDLKGDKETLAKIEEAEKVLEALRRQLAPD